MLHSTDPTTIYVPGLGRRSNGLYLYFHTDWLGTTRYTSRSGGVATEQLRYDGWGQRIWLNHLDPANPFNPFHPTDFQWGGEWGLQTETAYPNEPGLDLHYIEQRYCDPLLTRFAASRR